MPKLLDYLKEKGLSHQDVIDIIDNLKDGLPETQEEEKEIPEEEIQEDDKPEEKHELYITNMKSEEPEAEVETVTEEEITLTKEELDKKITDAVEEKLKAKRKVPSKGKIVDKPQANVPTVKRNWFEEIV